MLTKIENTTVELKKQFLYGVFGYHLPRMFTVRLRVLRSLHTKVPFIGNSPPPPDNYRTHFTTVIFAFLYANDPRRLP